MSLINEMLRDLEARRAGELASSNLQREIRPLPERRRDRSSWKLLVMVATPLALGVAVLAWWQEDVWLAGKITESAPPPSPQVAAPSPMPAIPSAVVPAETPQAVVSEALRLAVTLETAPAEKEQSKSIEVMPIKTEPQSVKPDVAQLKPKVAETPPASQGSIEKTAVLGTPRERADAEFRRAQGALANGQVAAAHEALLAALKHDATYVPARQSLLRILLESRRIDEAMAVLQEGLDLFPAQVGWAMSLARLAVERGDTAGAERVLARSAAYAAGNAEYVGFHGHLLNRMGQSKAAAEQYLTASRLAPNDGRWWFGLGQSLESDGRNQEAREAYRHAIATGNLNADLAALAEQKVH